MSKKAATVPDVLQTKVLLAEDDESFIDALVIGLTREGFDVTVARDGNEALRLFAAVEPDLVLLDLMLPRLSGIDVCRSIRARSSVPIIMVTAKGTEIDTVVGLEVGADDYVAKPYRLRELVARMRAVLRRTPLSEDVEPDPSSPRPGNVPDIRDGPDRRGATARARGRGDPDRPRPPPGLRPGRGRPPASQGVRAAVAADGERRSAAHPRRPHRPDLGVRLLRRHQDPRRPHQAVAQPRRRGPVGAQADHHHPRGRLPLRPPRD